MEDYGNGTSTGLDQTAAGKIFTGFAPDDVAMSAEDRSVLRTLAERVAKIAASEQMAETRRLWTKLNGLKKTRPLVFCDPENGWNEIITEPQMQCRGKVARRWEMDLRKEIFWGEVMGDDKPVEPYFDVPYTVSPDDWGLQADYEKKEAAGTSYTWHGVVKDYAADLKRLHSPQFEIDWETTNGCLAIARETLGDLLTVRLKGTWWWSLGLTWLAATFRGLQNMLCDFIENPDELKELLAIISRGHLDKLDWLESQGLLSLNNDGTYVGSGGFGFSDELPQADFRRQGPPPRHVGIHREPGDAPGLAGDVRGVRLSLREADHGALRAELLRLLRAAARPLARGAAASASPPRFLLAVGGRGQDGRVPGRQVRLLAETQSRRVGHRARRPGGHPQGPARES